MSGETSIEWATHVWNPTKGCDRVSPGCDHCYALTMAKRLKGMGQAEYQQDGDPRTSGPGFLAHEAPRDLDWPLTKRKPMRVFVNSMSDLFHDISDDFIARVFAVMAIAEQHTFQVLTKRHARMRSLLSSDDFRGEVAHCIVDLRLAGRGPEEFADPFADWWPLPNVWLGVSADIRIPALLDTPAAVRFLSCEPLLGPVDLARAFARRCAFTRWRVSRPALSQQIISIRAEVAAAAIPACGTLPAYRRHLRRKEPTDPACRDANNLHHYSAMLRRRARAGLPPPDPNRGRRRRIAQVSRAGHIENPSQRTLIEQVIARGLSTSWIMNAYDVDYATVQAVRDNLDAAAVA